MAGNSLGGGIAWSFAAAYPDMISRLILIDSAGYFRQTSPPLVFRLARAPVIGMLTRYLTPRYFIKKILLEVYGDDGKVTEELIDRYHDMALREGNRDAFIARSKMTHLHLYESDKIKTISTPVLIMWGSADAWIAPEFARRFQTDIKNSRLIIYDGIGHVPMEEIPGKTAADAKIFLLNI
jgi:pimeloyl-ACP methyl ester carboxylesterase